MSLVFAGVCSHAPGITGRAHLADPALRDPFHAAFRALSQEMFATKPDALVLVGAEHFGNFLRNQPRIMAFYNFSNMIRLYHIRHFNQI